MVWSKKRTSSRPRNSWSRDRKDGAAGGAVLPHTGDSNQGTTPEPRSKRTNPQHPAWDGEGFTGGMITRVALQQRSGAERLNVFLDGEYAFSVSAVVGSHLRDEMRLE